ncbi:MAG TPA: hypothetical protein VFN03_05070 [Trueperaceae bacterium]|nr:hypothetical protein [Trueperaceae bacterium]
MSPLSHLLQRWALALMWGSLGLGLVFGPVTPVLLPWEAAQALIDERLMLTLSTFALLSLLLAITSGRSWAWLAFAAYYALNLSVSLRMAALLLTMAGPFGIPYALQLVGQMAGLVLYFVATGRVRCRAHDASQ